MKRLLLKRLMLLFGFYTLNKKKMVKVAQSGYHHLVTWQIAFLNIYIVSIRIRPNGHNS